MAGSTVFAILRNAFCTDSAVEIAASVSEPAIMEGVSAFTTGSEALFGEGFARNINARANPITMPRITRFAMKKFRECNFYAIDIDYILR